MAFSTQMFPSGESFDDHSFSPITVVRPLLQFTKADMYKICRIWNLCWVEDPTNQSVQYSRNRIRMTLQQLPSSCLSELQMVISACRKTRSYVEGVCQILIQKAVTIMDEGYAVIDLTILNPSEVVDLCLSKFISSIIQFISQRNRNVRGHTLKLLLDYCRNFPCKTSFTASGCYLCPAPGSKGTKILICCSVDCPPPRETELCHIYPKQDEDLPTGLPQIVAPLISSRDDLIPDILDAPFLKTSATILEEATRLCMISQDNCLSILSLQREETESFRSQIVEKVDGRRSKQLPSSIQATTISLQSNQVCYFMNRFIVTWERSRSKTTDQHVHSCRISNEVAVNLRTMLESDWLYLADLMKNAESYLKQSAERAILALKRIPVAARRSIPVLISSEGQLLSIPSINFAYCSCIKASCVFFPKIPLGDNNSFL